jgi:hypothetical protein
MGILQHSWTLALADSRTCSEVQVGTEPAILVHTSDKNDSLKVQNAVRPQPDFQVEE